MKTRKGVSQQLVQAFSLPLLIIILLSVYVQFSTNVDRSGWTTDQNTTYDKVDTGTESGFNLASMLPYIIIALTILALMLKYLGVF